MLMASSKAEYGILEKEWVISETAQLLMVEEEEDLVTEVFEGWWVEKKK